MLEILLRPDVIVTAFLAAQIADVLTTIRVLKNPGGREVNPIMAIFIAATAFWPVIKVTAATALLAGLWWFDALPWAWAITTITAGIALNNWRVGS